MDDKCFHVILTVARTGSLSKAAEKLGYSQPGLTQMLNRVENELGCHLFLRDHSGVELTEGGRRLLPCFERANDAVCQLQSEAAQICGKSNQRIRIGAYPSIMQSILPPLIKEFQKAYPNYSIEISVSGYQIQKWLAEGSVDLGFVDETICGAYNWIPLMEELYFAAVPLDCPLSRQKSVTIQQLSQYPFILSQINELKALGELNGIHEKLNIAAEDDAALLALISQGLGVTVLPASSLAGHSAQIRVLELEPPMKRTLGIISKKSANRAAHTFARFAKAAHIPQFDVSARTDATS